MRLELAMAASVLEEDRNVLAALGEQEEQGQLLVQGGGVETPRLPD